MVSVSRRARRGPSLEYMLALSSHLTTLILSVMERHTQVLHILIPSNSHRAALSLPTLGTGPVALKHNDPVSGSGCDESSAVGEASPAAGGVEGDVAQTVAEGAEQEGDMAAEPGELQAGIIKICQ